MLGMAESAAWQEGSWIMRKPQVCSVSISSAYRTPTVRPTTIYDCGFCFRDTTSAYVVHPMIRWLMPNYIKIVASDMESIRTVDSAGKESIIRRVSLIRKVQQRLIASKPGTHLPASSAFSRIGMDGQDIVLHISSNAVRISHRFLPLRRWQRLP